MKYLFIIGCLALPSVASAQYVDNYEYASSNDHGMSAEVQQSRDLTQQGNDQYRRDQMRDQIQSQQQQIDHQQQEINNYNNATPVQRIYGAY